MMRTVHEVIATIEAAIAANHCTCGHDRSDHHTKSWCLVDGCPCTMFCTPMPKMLPGERVISALRAKGFVILAEGDVALAARVLQEGASTRRQLGVEARPLMSAMERFEEAIG